MMALQVIIQNPFSARSRAMPSSKMLNISVSVWRSMIFLGSEEGWIFSEAKYVVGWSSFKSAARVLLMKHDLWCIGLLVGIQKNQGFEDKHVDVRLRQCFHWGNKIFPLAEHQQYDLQWIHCQDERLAVSCRIFGRCVGNTGMIPKAFTWEQTTRCFKWLFMRIRGCVNSCFLLTY